MRLPELPAQNPAWYIGVVTACASLIHLHLCVRSLTLFAKFWIGLGLCDLVMCVNEKGWHYCSISNISI